ncbi:16684_t:CDS:2 [Cetraspora pellucida]|uniref:16684_t:CDS:1 n=1 Tax=Cetraspora pellucida TaxID=1433469 RepID=A0A9N9DPL2_9GLOM|nr:16684_t:CDS:2 [Cetraspora pellucida]
MPEFGKDNVTGIEKSDIKYDAPQWGWQEVMCSYKPMSPLQILGIWATTVMLIVSFIRLWLRKGSKKSVIWKYIIHSFIITIDIVLVFVDIGKRQKLDFYLVMAMLPLIFVIHGGNSAGGLIQSCTGCQCCQCMRPCYVQCMTHPCPLPACAWFGWNVLLCIENTPSLFLFAQMCIDEEKGDPAKYLDKYSPDRSHLVTFIGGWWFIISSAVAIANTVMYVNCGNTELGQAPIFSHLISFWFGALWDFFDLLIHCLLS